MNKSRVVFSFDDGRKDNYDVALPILQKYNIPATFNIATAYIDGTITQKDVPCQNKAMSVADVCEIEKAGFEIACHGDCHRNDRTDIENGLNKLRQWLGWNEDYKPGFASPQSNLSSNEIKSNINEYKGLFLYMRTSSYKNQIFSNRIVRKAAHLSHSNYLYKKVFKGSIGGIVDGFIAVSVPILNMATVEQVKSVIKATVKNKQDVILMLHSIIPQGEPHFNDMWSWDAKKFDSLCKWLRQEKDRGSLDVKRTIDLL